MFIKFRSNKFLLNTEYSKMNAQYMFHSWRAQNNDKISISIYLHILFNFANWLYTLLVPVFITSFLHTKTAVSKTCWGKATLEN